MTPDELARLWKQVVPGNPSGFTRFGTLGPLARRKLALAIRSRGPGFDWRGLFDKVAATPELRGAVRKFQRKHFKKDLDILAEAQFRAPLLWVVENIERVQNV